MEAAQIDADAKAIYNYHRLSSSLPHLNPADAIFCLCSLDTRVAHHAAGLYLKGLAPLLIFSGGSGKLTAGRFDASEADAFAFIAKSLGVPEDKIITEGKSQNTGENVRFTYDLLQQRGLSIGSFILVQKPYMERRTWATFAKQWPDAQTRFDVTSPDISFEEYFDEQNPRELIYNVMVGDLVRLRVYAERGFQVEMDVGDEIWETGQRLIRQGYDKHLP